MEHSPIEEAICDITVSEFVPTPLTQLFHRCD